VVVPRCGVCVGGGMATTAASACCAAPVWLPLSKDAGAGADPQVLALQQVVSPPVDLASLGVPRLLRLAGASTSCEDIQRAQVALPWVGWVGGVQLKQRVWHGCGEHVLHVDLPLHAANSGVLQFMLPQPTGQGTTGRARSWPHNHAPGPAGAQTHPKPPGQRECRAQHAKKTGRLPCLMCNPGVCGASRLFYSRQAGRPARWCAALVPGPRAARLSPSTPPARTSSTNANIALCAGMRRLAPCTAGLPGAALILPRCFL